jgi:hypothetical protein
MTLRNTTTRITGVALTIALLQLATPASAATDTVLRFTGKASKTTAIDVSGKNNDGRLHNVTVTKRGFYSFNEPARIRVPASKSINPGTADYSYQVTMRLPKDYTFSKDLSLVRRGAAKLSGAYYKMEIIHHRDSKTTVLVCAMRDKDGNTGYVQTTATGLNDGEWHILTCSKTDTTVQLDKDSSTYTKDDAVGNLSSSHPLFFGAEQVDANTYWEHFPGHLDNITITKG